MHRQPAKVLEPEDVRLMLEHVRDQRYPERNHVMILLSCKAGLRACEIAGLTWPMVLDSSNQVGSAITVARAIAKCRSGRSIPMHRQLHRALAQLHKRDGYPYDYHRLLYTFRMKSRARDVGIYRPRHHWTFSPGIRFKPPETS